ncbi:FMRFamide-related peptides [Rhagoletis pomonella]|uniref:FMRFamide-related peptides n=1 Tax=Rhagoletis pomonella TaxID=28610 RepID=UPI00177F7C80|nr:FMRFamide-related peptides [Rhagoletis pomonella]
MSPLLVFFLYIIQLQAAIRSEIIETPNINLNTISESEDDDIQSSDSIERKSTTTTTVDPLDLPYVKTTRDQTEVEFRYPIASLNIDYSKNLIILKFRKSKADDEEARRRKSLDENFMRFGRANSDFMRFGRDAADFMRFGRSPSDFMRFGKRSLEQIPKVNSLDHEYNYDKDADTSRRFERSQEAIRDSRGDNFMRFGRPAEDFMRFGRSSSNDFLRFGRASGDFMRFGRNPSDFMRFGRGGSDDFMRFGRSPDFMRFGRAQKERRDTDRDFMRFGRPDNFMRFGRSSGMPTVSPNFIRFGKLDPNFMRFGKHLDHQAQENTSTKPPLPKEVIKEAAKILNQAERFGGEGESNPMDRAIKVLFGKEGGHKLSSAQRERAAQSNEDTSNANEVEPDYELNVSQ